MQDYKQIYNTLEQNDITVLSIKTDAFTILSQHVEKAKQLLNFGDNIGSWRVSNEGKHIRFPTVKFELKINHEMKYTITQFNKISINNEWDVNELYDKIVEHKHVIIRAAMPGSGKSYACEYFKEKGHKILFVCPTNVLVQKYLLKGIDAVTVDKFLVLACAQMLS
jgi:hypothetical protein